MINQKVYILAHKLNGVTFYHAAFTSKEKLANYVAEFIANPDSYWYSTEVPLDPKDGEGL